MIKRLAFVLGLCALLLAAAPVGAQRDVRAQIKTIGNYVVYYGEGRADALARYNLAIIQPNTLGGEELAALKARGTLAVAYLSIGESDDDTRVQPDWILGKNTNWDSSFMDARKPGWQELVLADAQNIIDAGFDGLFLDTVDTAELYPDTGAAMILLIGRLRKAFPDHLLIQNRGLTLLDRTAQYVDADMIEDLTTSYDFDHQTYIHIEPDAETIDLLQTLQGKDKTGLVVLALDYAAADDTETACSATRAARKYGFIPAISVILLDDLPDYPLDECAG
jgi:uncharacterized protein (TIGR01370 family)